MPQWFTFATLNLDPDQSKVSGPRRDVQQQKSLVVLEMIRLKSMKVSCQEGNFRRHRIDFIHSHKQGGSDRGRLSLSLSLCLRGNVPIGKVIQREPVLRP